MSRRRRSSMATFELEPEELRADDPRADDPRGPDEDAPGPGERLGAALRRVRPRTWAVVAGAVVGAVVLAGAGTAVGNALAERHRLALLAAAPGGVLDVAAVVSGAGGWSVDTDSGVLAVLTGGVVVVQDGADAVGLDATTGAEVWRETLGSLVECGPTPYSPADWATPVEQVVCLSGEDTDRTVTVVAADGTVVGSRGLGDVSDLVVAPAAGGSLFVVEPDGPLPAPRTVAGDGAVEGALRTLDAPGSHARFEDALTGTPTEPVAIPFAPRDSELCVGWVDDDVQLTFDGYMILSSPRLVEFARCGAQLVAAPPGADAMAPLVGTPSGDQEVTPSVDGGVVVPQEDGRTRLTALGGADVLLPGVLLDPDATDGTVGPRLVLTTDGLEALEPDDLTGDPLWVRPRPGAGGSDAGVVDDGTEVLVRTADAVLLQEATGALVGLDRDTGAERWRVTEPVDGWQDERWLQDVVTDGHDALLMVVVPDGGLTWVRLDLATGEVRQADARDGSASAAVGAVDGTLLLRTSTGTGSIDDVGGGIVVHRDPGSLQGAGRA
ncbi:PQQ-binding-like beta-propeller repeat protein [Isoptericola sp. NPDC057191]|uniref:outer membrane protein assembly factor BamB family protein n=1 Tax=Isoptericola sp. NPDC057191 TaxID=3346041 RepID=UPI00362F1F6C